MSKAKAKAKSPTKARAAERALRPGAGNPSWLRAYVTESIPHDWERRRAAANYEGLRKTAPITVEAGPGDEYDRVTVSLGHSTVVRKHDGRDIELFIDLYCPMLAREQRIQCPITLAQAHSLEESIRAVFRAARAKGILPVKQA